MIISIEYYYGLDKKDFRGWIILDTEIQRYYSGIPESWTYAKSHAERYSSKEQADLVIEHEIS